MSVPVAMIPYTNMAPYRELGAPTGCHFVPLVPKASIDALLEGTVAAAAVPVGGLDRLGDTVASVGVYGIAAKGPSMSVLLFSRVPFEALRRPLTLQVTSETASSVKLLYLLLGRTVGFDKLPFLTAGERPADGELLIGDRALVRGQAARAGVSSGTVTDLSQKWLELHGLPFVFARWVVRRDAPEAIKTEIASWLETFRAQEARLVEKAVDPSARALGLPPAVVRHYFSVIRRSLDEEDLRGQREFIQAFDRHGRQPLFRRMSPRM